MQLTGARPAGSGVIGLRRSIAILASVLAGTLLGAAAGLAPGPVVMAVAGLAGIAAIFLVPVWALAPMTIAAGATLGIAHVWLGGVGMGHGDLITALTAFAVLRAALARVPLKAPKVVVVGIALFIGSLFLSALNGAVLGTSREAVLSNLQQDVSFVAGGFLVGAIAMSAACRRGGTMNMFRAIAVFALLGSVLAILQWAWVHDFAPMPPPLASLFEAARQSAVSLLASPFRANMPFADQHPNLAAAILIGLIAWSLPPLLREGGSRDRTFALLTLAASTLAIIGSESRTGLVTALFGGFVFVILSRSTSWRAKIGTIAGFAVVAMVTILVANSFFVEERSLADAGTLGSRLEIWGEALRDVGEHPVLGAGFRVSEDAVWGESIHNEMLGRLVDGGIVGFAIFAFALATFIQIAFELRRRDGELGLIGLGGLVFLATQVLFMTTSAVWASSAVATILSWLVFGMLAAAHSYMTDQDRQRDRHTVIPASGRVPPLPVPARSR